MDLIKCPRCGEMYSPSYRKCPFCEEEDRPRRTANKRSGHHVSETKRTHSARGPMIAVLLVVLMVLSWYLFGGALVEKLQGEEPVPPLTDAEQDTETPDGGLLDDLGYDPSIGTEPSVTDPDDPTPPVVDEPDEPDEPSVPDEPQTPAVDPASLKLKTNVGSLSRDAGTGKYDCSLSLSDTYIKLIVQGTDAQVTWSSADTGIVTVGSDGLLKPVKVGTTTVTASVGGATLACIVRIK